MRKFYFILVAIFSIAGCSSDSGDSAPSSSCGGVATFSVVQDVDVLKFNYTGNSDVSYYEISYFQTGATNTPDNGSKFYTSDTSTFTKKVSEMNAQIGVNNSFYIRTICSSGETSSWKGPVYLVFEPYCGEPRDLKMNISYDGSAFTWQNSYNNESSYYEIQYGPEGFELGEGTIIPTNFTQISSMVMQRNKIYDFYVRSKCVGNLGWSSWAGPVSHISTIDQNICSAPISARGNIESYSGSNTWVRMTWQTNGNMNANFEYVIVNRGNAPESGTRRLFNPYLGWPVVSIPTYGQYDFYVRTVCSDSTLTDWFGPTPLDY